MSSHWCDCTDPDRLAEIVATGGDVFVLDPVAGRFPSGSRTAEDFVGWLAQGVRYVVGAPSAEYHPEAPPAVVELVAILRGGGAS